MLFIDIIIALVMIGMFVIGKWLLKLFGYKMPKQFLESFGVVFFEAYKYFTYTLPNKRNGKLQELRKKREEESELAKAAVEREQYVHKIQNIDKLLTGVLNRANFLQNKYPYASQELISKFIKDFSKCSVEEIAKMEDDIKQSHLRNKEVNENGENANYNLSDLSGLSPFAEKDEYPFQMRLFKINNTYILHIRDTLERTDVLYQTSDYNKVNGFMSDSEQKFEVLKVQNQQVVAQHLDLNVKSNKRFGGGRI